MEESAPQSGESRNGASLDNVRDARGQSKAVEKNKVGRPAIIVILPTEPTERRQSREAPLTFAFERIPAAMKARATLAKTAKQPQAPREGTNRDKLRNALAAAPPMPTDGTAFD